MDYRAVVAQLRIERDEIEKVIVSLERFSGIRRRRGRPPGRSRSQTRRSNAKTGPAPDPVPINQDTRAAASKSTA